MSRDRKAITIEDDPDPRRHASPIKVTWYPPKKGKKESARRKWFKTRAAAEAYASEVRKLLAVGLSPEEIAEIARLVAGTGYRAVDLAKAGLEQVRAIKATAVSPTVTFSDAAKLLRKNLEKSDEVRPRTVTGYLSVLDVLEKTFGPKIAALISANEFRSYLDNKADRAGDAGKASASTRNNHLVVFRMVMQAIGIEKAVPEIKKAKDPIHEVEIFSNAEVRLMFGALDDDERGQFAFALYGFIRPEVTGLLPPENINIDRGTILIPGDLAKDRKEHWLTREHRRADGTVLPGVPDELFIWLKAFGFHPKPWWKIQKKLKRALGGRWVADGVRHTGASNYNAYHGVEATSKMLTHAGERLAWKHYIRGLLPSHADEFYGILPSQFRSSSTRPPRNHSPFSFPGLDELRQRLVTTPVRTIANEIGCSDVTLAKHCRKHGLQLPARGHWQKVRCGATSPSLPAECNPSCTAEPRTDAVSPSQPAGSSTRSPRNRSHFSFPGLDELRRRLATTPVRTIANEIGCSDVALAKHCRKHGLQLPARGHWQKVRCGATPPSLPAECNPSCTAEHRTEAA